MLDSDEQVLCNLADLPEQGSARLAFDGDKYGHGLCVVRQNDQLFAYHNRCPHALAPMDWQPGDFLDIDKEHIVCSWHGAHFRIDDGFCVFGPCKGRSLTRRELRVEAGQVVLLPLKD